MSGEKYRIYSYKHVFRREWRIYKIERWRIPIRGGIPLFVALWFAAAQVVVLIASLIPPFSSLYDAVHPVYMHAIIPGFIAFAMTQLKPDGRSARQFFVSMLAFHIRNKKRSARRPMTTTLRTRFSLPVGSDRHRADLAKARIYGPAKFRLPEPMVISETWRSNKRKKARKPVPGRMGDVTQEVELAEGEFLDIMP